MTKKKKTRRKRSTTNKTKNELTSKKRKHTSKQQTSKKRRKKKSSNKKRSSSQQRKASRLREIRDIGIAFLLVFLVFLIVSGSFFSIRQIKTVAMYPELNKGDLVVVNKSVELNRLDIVYYKDAEGKPTVGRIMAKTGDHIRYEADQFYLNNRGKTDHFLDTLKNKVKTGNYTNDFSLEEVTGKMRVPKNEYFIMSDNRQQTKDSRTFGTVPRKKIVGKVDVRLFSKSPLKKYH